MAGPTKLGVALLVALASNATLFSMFFTSRKSGKTGTPTTTITTTSTGAATTATTSSFSHDELIGMPQNLVHAAAPNANNSRGEGNTRGAVFREYTALERVSLRQQNARVNNARDPRSEERAEVFRPLAQPPTSVPSHQLQSFKTERDSNPVSEREDPDPKPRRGDIDPELQQKYLELWREKEKLDSSSPEDPGPTTRADLIPESEHEDSHQEHSDLVSEDEDVSPKDVSPAPDTVPQPEREDTKSEFEHKDVDLRSEKQDLNPSSEKQDLQGGSENPDLETERKTTDLKPPTVEDALDRGPERDPDLDDTSEGEEVGSRPEQREGSEIEDQGSRSQRSTPSNTASTHVDMGHRLYDVISSLTDSELQQLDPATSKILIRALVGLEGLVLRELERLYDVNQRQEKRLERLEAAKIEDKDVTDAINVIKQEQYKLERQQHKQELLQQLLPKPHAPSGTQPGLSSARDDDDVLPVSGADDRSSAEPLDASGDGDGDGSGSGDERLMMIFQTTTTPMMKAAIMTMMTTSAPATGNHTESIDSAIFSHIHELYNSLTSMEHKVMELDNRLTSVTSEVYRQRGRYVSMEERSGEGARNQKNLIMRTTMHGFKVADLEQFKGQAEVRLGTAEGTIEQLDTKLEILTDRLMEQQDEVEIMRNVFGRLEQVSNELRTADAFKAHDVHELRRGYQQVENRLTNLHQSLDRTLGNIRWDVKTYLEHLCTDNHLLC